jgi:hypothetical protein
MWLSARAALPGGRDQTGEPWDVDRRSRGGQRRVTRLGAVDYPTRAQPRAASALGPTAGATGSGRQSDEDESAAEVVV